MPNPLNAARSMMIAFCIPALCGCATDIMQSYVGRPLEAAMAGHGPPDHVFDLPDGRRAFQWVDVNTSTSPGYAVSRTTGDLHARPGAYRDRTSITTTTELSPPSVSVNRCFYTMYARYDHASAGWVFDSFERPRFGC